MTSAGSLDSPVSEADLFVASPIEGRQWMDERTNELVRIFQDRVRPHIAAGRIGRLATMDVRAVDADADFEVRRGILHAIAGSRLRLWWLAWRRRAALSDTRPRDDLFLDVMTAFNVAAWLRAVVVLSTRANRHVIDEGRDDFLNVM